MAAYERKKERSAEEEEKKLPERGCKRKSFRKGGELNLRVGGGFVRRCGMKNETEEEEERELEWLQELCIVRCTVGVEGVRVVFEGKYKRVGKSIVRRSSCSGHGIKTEIKDKGNEINVGKTRGWL